MEHAADTITDLADRLASMQARIDGLEARVAQLESTPRRTASPARAASGGGAPPAWAVPYEVAQLEVSETWIELHEPSARPQLHRLINQVVEVEGPVTVQLALRRVREAWGLKRAGARIQEVFDQALRQLAAQGKLVRSHGNEVLTRRGEDVERVRVPADGDESTRRSVDEVPAPELELALLLTARDAGRSQADELTMQVARIFGWTRRGTEIQSTLDRRLEALITRGALQRDGSVIVAVADPQA